MFIYNVAFSLELLVIGLGAFLISWAIHKKDCYGHGVTREQVSSNLTPNTTTEIVKTCGTKHCGGTGFAQAIGVILIILALINLVDTVYCVAKFRHHIHKLRERIENTQPANTAPAQPVNNPATPENSGY